MDYAKTYFKLILKAKARRPEDIAELYTEKHHIFPRCLFGDNQHVVSLTYKEHLVAHHLLYKIFLKSYGENHFSTIKMAHCLKWFLNLPKKQSLGRGLSKIISAISRSGKIKYAHTAETKQKISEAQRGKVLTDSHKKKIGAALKGKYIGELNSRYGSTGSELHSRKLTELFLGVPKPDTQRKNISKALKGKYIGELSPSYKGERYTWVNKERGLIEKDSTMLEMVAKYPELRHNALGELKNKKKPHYKGWTVDLGVAN